MKTAVTSSDRQQRPIDSSEIVWKVEKNRRKALQSGQFF